MKLDKSQGKKLRRRSISIALTAVIIILVFALNIIFSAICESKRLYIDMTPEGIYDISKTTDTLFDEYVIPELEEAMKSGKLDTRKGAYKIIFLNDEDSIKNGYVESTAQSKLTISESFSAFFNNNDIINARDALKQVYEYAKEYEKRYDFIEVLCVDPDERPDLLESYVKHTVDAELEHTDVIISDFNGTYSIFKYSLFFRKDSSNGYKLFAFSGESRITSAILSFCTNDAVAYITTGHGETTSSLTAFRDLLNTVGFTVEDIDLTRDEIDERAKLIIINSPKTDFFGVDDDVNEIKILDDFLDAGGHLMAFLDYKYETPELEGFLSDWGIFFNHALVAEDAAHSLSDDGKIISAEFNRDESQLGYQLGSTLLSLDSLPKAVVADTQTMYLRAPNSAHTDVDVSPVLLASAAAKGLVYDTEKEEFGKEVSEAGNYYLVLTSETQKLERKINGRTVSGEFYSYLLAGGASSFIDDKYIDGNKYSNSDLLFTILHAMIMDDLPIESQTITFTEYQLDLTFDTNTTANEVYSWFTVMAAVIPALFIVAGIVVYVRRRHL